MNDEGSALGAVPASIHEAQQGILYYAPAEEAWKGLQDLHLLALGEAPRFGSDVSELTPDAAFRTYSNAVVGVLAQLTATEAEGSLAALESMCDYVDAAGSLDGLESVFLSATIGAGGKRGQVLFQLATGSRRDAVVDDAFADAIQALPDVVKRAYGLLKDIDVPERISGGAESSPVLNPISHEMTVAGASEFRELIERARTGGRNSGHSSGSFGDWLEGVGRFFVDAATKAKEAIHDVIDSPLGHVARGVLEIGGGLSLVFTGHIPRGIAIGLHGAHRLDTGLSGTPASPGETIEEAAQDLAQSLKSFGSAVVGASTAPGTTPESGSQPPGDSGSDDRRGSDPRGENERRRGDDDRDGDDRNGSSDDSDSEARTGQETGSREGLNPLICPPGEEVEIPGFAKRFNNPLWTGAEVDSALESVATHGVVGLDEAFPEGAFETSTATQREQPWNWSLRGYGKRVDTAMLETPSEQRDSVDTPDLSMAKAPARSPADAITDALQWLKEHPYGV